MSSYRNSTPILITRRTNVTAATNQDGNIIAQLRHDINEVRKELADVKCLLQDLVTTLAPVFPMNTDEDKSNPIIYEASLHAQGNATASMSNANLKGPRYLEKMLPEAKQRSNGGRTPFNSIRITALLKVLKASHYGAKCS